MKPHCCLSASVLRGSVLSDSLWPQEPHPTRLLCPCDFPSRNTGADCHFLLQGNLAEPGMEIGLLCLLHFRRILYGWASSLSQWIFLVMSIKNSITGRSIGINEGILSAKILWFLCYFSHRCEILIDVQISLLFVFPVKHFQVTVAFSFDILVFNFSFWNNHRVMGSCKDSTEWSQIPFTQFLQAVTVYATTEQYQNQKNWPCYSMQCVVFPLSFVTVIIFWGDFLLW